MRSIVTFIASILIAVTLAGPAQAAGTRISGEVLRFWVRTDTTPLYWDVVAQMELRLALRPPGDAGEVRNVSHACEHRERTYAWPSQALVEKTLDACLYDLLTAFRADFL